MDGQPTDFFLVAKPSQGLAAHIHPASIFCVVLGRLMGLLSCLSTLLNEGDN